ncbi:MAG: hypothetical protein ACE5KS_09985, partial [Woeseiaceae bacterium]
MSDHHFTRRKFICGSLAAPLLAGLRTESNAAGGNDGASYRIESIQLYVRVTPVGRFPVAIGRHKGPAKPERNSLAHVRMVMRDASGTRTFGCSGDRMSVRWLDKRPGRSKDLKLRELVKLIERARDVYLRQPHFGSPFDKWLSCHREIHKAGRAAGQEDLTSSYASALLERAMLDAVCRLAGRPIFEMVREDRLGFRPARLHPELRDLRPADYLPGKPVTRFHIRHTVGLAD